MIKLNRIGTIFSFVFIVLIIGCSKDHENVVDSNNSYSTANLHSTINNAEAIKKPNNPFDYTLGDYILNCIEFVNNTQLDSGEAFPTFEEYLLSYTSFFEMNEIVVDLSDDAFSSEELGYMNTIDVLIDECTVFPDFIEGVLIQEANINNDGALNNEQKCRLLAYSSVQKHIVYVSVVVGYYVGGIPQATPWDYYYDYCMRRQIQAMWNNWVLTLQFSINPAAWVLWTGAACAYEATMTVRNLPQ